MVRIKVKLRKTGLNKYKHMFIDPKIKTCNQINFLFKKKLKPKQTKES